MSDDKPMFPNMQKSTNDLIRDIWNEAIEAAALELKAQSTGSWVEYYCDIIRKLKR